MAPVTVDDYRIQIGNRFSIVFLRTLRVPDDGRVYPLPPGLGEFHLHRVADHASRVPPEWLTEGGVFISLFQREALWIGFEGAVWKPNAVKVGVGDVDALTGGAWNEALAADPQNYLVCPPQPWLDGINAGSGFVRQFVAAPLGTAESIEAQVTGHDAGGLRLLVYESRAGRFPDQPPARRRPSGGAAEAVGGGALSVGAGGMIRQRIYPDPYGVDTWDPTNFAEIRVHLLNSSEYTAVTGLQPPPSPIDAGTYTRLGFPWFDRYDETRGDIPAAEPLAHIQTSRDDDGRASGISGTADPSSPVPDAQIRRLPDGTSRPGQGRVPPSDY